MQFPLCFGSGFRQGCVHQLSLLKDLISLPWLNRRAQTAQFNKEVTAIFVKEGTGKEGGQGGVRTIRRRAKRARKRRGQIRKRVGEGAGEGVGQREQ